MKPALLALLILLSSCSAIPTSPRLPAMSNDCLPQAAAMVQGLAKYDIPAEVLVMRYADRDMGHAVAVYRYRGRKYGWDRLTGTTELSATWAPYFLGYDWHKQTRDPRLIIDAFFIHEPEENL
jgi:hypothetical protein